MTGSPVLLRSSVGDFGLGLQGSGLFRVGGGEGSSGEGKVVLVGGAGGDVSVHVEPTGSGVKVVFEVPSRESFGSGLFQTLSLPAGWSAVQDGRRVVLLDPSGAPGGSWSGGPVWDGARVAGPDAWIELVGVVGGVATVRVVIDAGWVGDPARVFPLFVDPLIAVFGPAGAATATLAPGPVGSWWPVITAGRPGSGTHAGAPGDMQIQVTNTNSYTWAANQYCFIYGIRTPGGVVQSWVSHSQCAPALSPGASATVTVNYQLGPDRGPGAYEVIFQLMNPAGYAVGPKALMMPFTATHALLGTAPVSMSFSNNNPLRLQINTHGSAAYRFSIQPAVAGMSAANCLSGTVKTDWIADWLVPSTVVAGPGTYFWCGQGISGDQATAWETQVVRYDTPQALGLLGLKDGQDAVIKGVDLASGNWAFGRTDVELGAVGPALGLSRVYNSFDQTPGIFGVGWSSGLEMSLAGMAGTLFGATLMLVDADGGTVQYTPAALGLPAPVASQLVQTAVLGQVEWNLIARWDGPGGNTSWVERDGTGFRVWYLDGTSRLFNSAGWLSEIKTAAGNRQELLYTGAKVTSIRDEVSGRSISITYGGPTGSVVTSVTVADPTQLTGTVSWSYTYADLAATNPRLTKACNPMYCESYVWGSRSGGDHAIFDVLDGLNRPVEQVTYWPNGLVATHRGTRRQPRSPQRRSTGPVSRSRPRSRCRSLTATVEPGPMGLTPCSVTSRKPRPGTSPRRTGMTRTG